MMVNLAGEQERDLARPRKLWAQQVAGWVQATLEHLHRGGSEGVDYEALVAQMQETGERAPFDVLWQKTRPLLVDFLERDFEPLTREDCEDVVQETGVAVWQGFRYGNFRGWLVLCGTRAYQRAYNQLRRSGRMEVRPLEEGEEPADPGPPVEDRALLKELFLHALNGLSSEYRALIVWRELKGWKVSEIAARLPGVSPNTVKNKLYRARRQLQRNLAAVGLGEE